MYTAETGAGYTYDACDFWPSCLALKTLWPVAVRHRFAV